jgi:hypothetical protein
MEKVKMKKVVRLNERELINIVKRVIREQDYVGGETPDYQDMYKDPKHSIEKFAFKDVPQEKLTEYLQWYPSGSYPETQEYLFQTYGLQKPYPLKDLENPGKQNSRYNLYRTFLGAVTGLLWVAAKNNLNGKGFLTFDLQKLNSQMGSRWVTADWRKALFQQTTESGPFVGNEKQFMEFVAKVIDNRRKAVGLTN